MVTINSRSSDRSRGAGSGGAKRNQALIDIHKPLHKHIPAYVLNFNIKTFQFKYNNVVISLKANMYRYIHMYLFVRVHKQKYVVFVTKSISNVKCSLCFVHEQLLLGLYISNRLTRHETFSCQNFQERT